MNGARLFCPILVPRGWSNTIPNSIRGDEVSRTSFALFPGVYKNSFGMLYSIVDHMPPIICIQKENLCRF